MKVSTSSILSFSAIFAACLYAATTHADMTPPQPPHEPPKEAVDACGGKAENDACNFTGRENQALTGTCHKGPDGRGILACVPAGHTGKPGDMGTLPQPPQ